MNIVFVADFFADQVPGGGELNNEELIKLLISRNHNVVKINSHLVDADFIEDKKKNEFCFIIANFVNLSKDCRELLEGENYIIYEHDHKYLTERNPAIFENFIAPEDAIINRDFYKGAKAVLCQTEFHTNIVRNNLKLDNIRNIGANLWSVEILEEIRLLAKNQKSKKCSIMDSPIAHKNTVGSIRYCRSKNLDYDLIPPLPYKRFLERLSQYASLVFFPNTPETLSRIVVESRMLGLSVITNDRVGATQEKWFSMKGVELIDFMENKREEIVDFVQSILEGK